MKLSYDDNTIAHCSQREIAEALGMHVPEDAKVTVINSVDEVTVTVRRKGAAK